MTLWVQGLINGVALGGLYAIFAVGIVVLYRTARTINFAQGSVGMFLAFVAWQLLEWGLPLWLAFAAGIVLGGVAGYLVEVAIMAPNRGREHLNELFRGLGLSLVLTAIAARLWGGNASVHFPSIVGYAGFQAASFYVLWLQVMIIVAAIAVAGAFILLLRTKRVGLVLRGVASDREIARMIGLRVRRVEQFGWITSCALAAAIGMLFAPMFALDPAMMAPFLLKGFTAALLGGLTSVPGAICGGMIVGIVDSEVSLHAAPEMRDVAMFLVMLGVLLVRPSGLFGQSHRTRV